MRTEVGLRRRSMAKRVSLSLSVQKVSVEAALSFIRSVFMTLKMHQIRFRAGLRPGPHWGSSRCSPRPPSRLGRGHPSPMPHPLDACGVSYSAPSAPRLQDPQIFRRGYAYVVLTLVGLSFHHFHIMYDPLKFLCGFVFM